MKRDQKFVIFKKNLSLKDSEVAFNFIAKDQFHEEARQSAWVEIKGLIKYETENEIQDPTALTTLLQGALMNVVIHTGQTEFASKNSPQSMSITNDDDAISTMIFLKAETYEQLTGILSSLHTQNELSLWARLEINEDQLSEFKHLNIPIEHITLTFS